MFIDIVERDFNTTKEIWENNGIKTYDVPLSAADCRVEGNDAIITLRLPHEDALYTDYASIMYWIQGDDGSEREESRAGLSVPSSCRMTVLIGDDDVSAQFTSTVSSTAKGFAELRIHCESVPALEGLIAAPKAVTYLRPMWYTGYGEDNALNPDRLTPDNTVVMEDMYDALDNSSLLEGRGQILNGKKYLFTFECPATDPDDTPNDKVFNWTNADGISLSPSYYEIIQKDGTESFTDDPNATGNLRYDGKFIYTTNGCIYVKMKRMNFFIGEDIGYGQDEIEDVLNGNVVEYFDDTEAFENIFNAFDTDEMLNINLRRNGLYLVSGTLSFEKSNICIIGHGSQIRIWKDIGSAPSLKYVVLFGESTSNDVYNVEVCDLNIFGRAVYIEGLDPQHKVFNPDQCVAFAIGDCENTENVQRTYPINMTFYNVSMDGFACGVHAHLPLFQKDEAISWKFINCELSRTQMGYNVFNTKDFVVSGGKIDTSLSSDKMQHCVYLNYGCSYFVVENCLLQNCTGGAIHQMGDKIGTKNEHNVYRNLTINNCFDGIVIVGYSLDIFVEHIRGENIGNFIYLANCGGVTIKDYKATQLPSATIHIGTGTEAHDFSHTAHYHLFHIDHCVDALIEDSEFSIDDVSFSENKDCSEFITIDKVDNPLDASNYEEGWVEDNCAIANVTFRNCKFSHKSNFYADIRPKSASYQSLNFVFDKCEFSVYRESIIGLAVYIFNKSQHKQSTFVLRDCKAYYSVENDDAIESLIYGYLFHTKEASLSIEGTYNVVTSFDVPVGKRSQNVNNNLA